jgi:ribosomal protein S21
MNTDKTEKRPKQGSVELIFRKFFREIQQSRILSEAKKRRYFGKDLTREQKREIARRKAFVKKLKRGY